MNRILTKNWKIFLILIAAVGLFLRISYGHDMEYKEDEEYNFVQTQLIGHSQPFPWVGMPSGVYIPNPGASIWVFFVLARAFSIHDPVVLAHAVQIFAWLGILLILPMAAYFVKREEREPWLWAFALAMVNPLLILYQRKLWPEPFMPAFCMIMLMGYYRRKGSLGAFFWGLAGAILGQIHMSGFFLAFALFAWTVIFAPDRKKIRWPAWFLGSSLGALPLIPWLIEWRTHPTSGAISAGLQEMIQLKYWVFWISNSLGLHLGNALGLMLGQSNLAQLQNFNPYPLIAGRATYLVLLSHLAITASSLLILVIALRFFWKNRKQILSLAIGRGSDTAFVQNAAFFGCGLILTLTGVVIRRYYLATTFPFELIWLARLALREPKFGRMYLGFLVTAQLVISASFVQFIHLNHGSTQGDYGPSYQTLSQVGGRTGRYGWDPNPPGLAPRDR